MSDRITLHVVEDDDFAQMIAGEPIARLGLSQPPGGVASAPILAIVRTMTATLHELGCRGSWLMVSDAEVVGMCSFRRIPRDGEVEIGYGVAESRRGRGFATRGVEAVLNASTGFGITVVVAETAVANPASARVLEKNGFVTIGTRVDPDDGEVFRWSKTLLVRGAAPPRRT